MMSLKKLSINKTRLLELNRDQFDPDKGQHMTETFFCISTFCTSMIKCHSTIFDMARLGESYDAPAAAHSL